jgi:cytochrome c1
MDADEEVSAAYQAIFEKDEILAGFLARLADECEEMARRIGGTEPNLSAAERAGAAALAKFRAKKKWKEASRAAQQGADYVRGAPAPVAVTNPAHDIIVERQQIHEILQKIAGECDRRKGKTDRQQVVSDNEPPFPRTVTGGADPNIVFVGLDKWIAANKAVSAAANSAREALSSGKLPI